MIFQGWFSMTPEKCFPPSSAIEPVFVGFHITDLFEAREWLLTGECLEYLRSHEPIGCRDEGTREMLERAGIRAFVTHCLTLTFPHRGRPPVGGKVCIVDGDGLPIPRRLRKGAVHQTHSCSPDLGEDAKMAMARQLLTFYRDQARLVITRRLHCALPCLAMGIPVVFFGNPDDYRLGVLRDLRIPIYRATPRSRVLNRACRIPPFRWAWRLWIKALVDWRPEPPDLSSEKQTLSDVVDRGLRRAEKAATMTPATDS